LVFNDTDGGFQGGISYLHTDDSMQVQVNNSERARIDSSGRLLVGTSSSYSAPVPESSTSAGSALQVHGTSSNAANINVCAWSGATARSGSITLGRSSGSGGIGVHSIVSDTQTIGSISFVGSDGEKFVRSARIDAQVDGTPGTDDMPGRLVFSTTADGASSPTERMRIKQTGSISCYQTGSDALILRSSLAAGATHKLITALHSGTGVDSGGTASFIVYTNGDVVNTNNSYGSISDIKLKENIVDARSQWDDLKALQVRNYNFREGQTHTQIGLVAQEVELVSPGLVGESPDRDADGNDLGTVTKSVNYSVLYMKAVKALQEAMERIETLEAKVAALEAV
jgi:hypothetical protein